MRSPSFQIVALLLALIVVPYAWGQAPKEVQSKLMLDIDQPSTFTMVDKKLGNLLLLMAEKSKYLKKGDMVQLMVFLGAQPMWSEGGKVTVNPATGKIEVTGDLFYVSQCMRTLANVAIAKKVDTKDFQYLGAGFGTGEVDLINKLLKEMGFEHHFDD